MSTDLAPGQLVTSPDGIKIWAHACGNSAKPAIVLVHGFACSADAFDKQYTNSTLLKNLYIIRYDVRGCGRSDAPLKQEAYSSERQAEDFKAVMDAFNVKKPFVATWSLGGIVPADVLSKYGPDSLAGVILLGSFPHRNMHGDVVHPVIVSLVPGLVSEDIAAFAETLPKFALSCVSPKTKLPYDVQCKWLGWAATQPPAVRQFMLGRSQDETGIMSVADRLPITSVHGLDDQHIVPEKLEKWLKDHFAKYEFHGLPGVGHVPFWEEPDTTNKLILEFVQKNSA